MGFFCRFRHLPSNGIIAKIILHDLYLLFKGQNFTMLISEMVRASAKNAQTDFFGFGYLPTNDTITRFTPNDLGLLFQGKK